MTDRPAPGSQARIDDTQSDIERTRGELSDTAETPPDKLNVFDRAHAAATPSLAVVASVAGVTVISLIWWRRRTGHRH